MAENAQLLKRLDPVEYFKKFLVEGIYPEGRAINSFRDTLIECKGITSDHQSSAYAQQGGTCISCTVRLSLAPDSDDMLFKWEIEAMESVPKDLIEHSQSHLQALLGNNCRFLLPEQLNICTQSEGKMIKKFQLHAILTSLQAALLNTRIPTLIEYKNSNISETLFAEDDDFLLGEEVPLEFNIEKVNIIEPELHNKHLKLDQLLVYLPFLLCPIENEKNKTERLLLCDPPADLCKLYNNDFCEIIIGKNGNIHLLSICSPSFSSTYSNDIDDKLVDEIVAIAMKRHSSVTSALNKCIL